MVRQTYEDKKVLVDQRLLKIVPKKVIEYDPNKSTRELSYDLESSQPMIQGIFTKSGSLVEKQRNSSMNKHMAKAYWKTSQLRIFEADCNNRRKVDLF